LAAGLNLKGTVWRMNQSSDDIVGGSVITGTMAYQNLAMRLNALRPSQVLLEQGLEVDRLFNASLLGRDVVINERDEIQITWPLHHPYHGERFRVLGVQLDSRRRRYGHTEITLSRIEKSRSQQ
jgi:hypothetical protein